MPYIRRAAFTVTELLITLMIIMLLIGVLVPVVNGVRRSSKATQCAVNMKRIGQAVLQYSQDNNGNLPLFKVEGRPGPYQFGEFWTRLIVKGGYLAAPNGLRDPESATSPFRCPEGTSEDFKEGEPFPNANMNLEARQAINSRGFSPRPIPPAGGEALAVRTWYQLNAAPESPTPDPNFDAPFVWVIAGPMPPESPRVKRTLSEVKKGAEMVMATEGPAWNQSIVGGNMTGGWPVIAGRHGKASEKSDGESNVLFFDGHVERIDQSWFRLYPNGQARQDMHFKSRTIFHLSDQE